jgi:hypothetical protein
MKIVAMLFTQCMILALIVVGGDLADARVIPAAGTLRGNVRSQMTGEACDTSKVVVTSADKRVQRIALTNDRGEYTIASLAPGKYSVTVMQGELVVEREVQIEAGMTLVIGTYLTPPPKPASSAPPGPPPHIDRPAPSSLSDLLSTVAPATQVTLLLGHSLSKRGKRVRVRHFNLHASKRLNAAEVQQVMGLLQSDTAFQGGINGCASPDLAAGLRFEMDGLRFDVVIDCGNVSLPGQDDVLSELTDLLWQQFVEAQIKTLK